MVEDFRWYHSISFTLTQILSWSSKYWIPIFLHAYLPAIFSNRILNEITKRSKSDKHWELGIFAHPLRPRTGVLASAHPKLRMRGSNPGPVSPANAQPLDDWVRWSMLMPNFNQPRILSDHFPLSETVELLVTASH